MFGLANVKKDYTDCILQIYIPEIRIIYRFFFCFFFLRGESKFIGKGKKYFEIMNFIMERLDLRK